MAPSNDEALKLQLVNQKIKLNRLKLEILQLKTKLNDKNFNKMVPNVKSNTKSNSSIKLTNDVIKMNFEKLKMPIFSKYQISKKDGHLNYSCSFLIRGDYEFSINFTTQNEQSDFLDLNIYKPLNPIIGANFECDESLMKKELGNLSEDFSEQKNIPLLLSGINEYIEKFKARRAVLLKIVNLDQFEVNENENGFQINVLKFKTFIIQWSFEWNREAQNIDTNYNIKLAECDDFVRENEEHILFMCDNPGMPARDIEEAWEVLIKAIENFSA